MTTATEFPAPGPAAPGSGDRAPITMLNPDFPFSYDHYLAHPDGLGTVPAGLHGTEVAVVGAGLSGLVAAYELMKLGLRPVLYEADQIGGRLRTASFPSAAGVVADLGGMRFPVSGKAFYHYVELLGLETQEFPNPLAAATSSTVIELAGQRHYARTPADLPPFFREVAEAWKAAVNDGAKFTEMQDAIRARDTARIKELWNGLLPCWMNRPSTASSPAATRSSKPVSRTARRSARWASAQAAGTRTSPTPSSRSCASSTPTPTTRTGSLPAGRNGSRRHSGSTRRRAWPTGPRGRRWRRCTPVPRAAPWTGSPGTAAATSASGSGGAARLPIRP